MCYLAKAFPSITQHNHAAMHFNFFSALHRDSANIPFCTETEECLLFEPICESKDYEVRENPLLLYIEYVKLENKRSSIFFLCTLGPSLWVCKMGYNRRVGLHRGFCHNDSVQETVQVHQGYYEPQPWLWHFLNNWLNSRANTEHKVGAAKIKTSKDWTTSWLFSVVIGGCTVWWFHKMFNVKHSFKNSFFFLLCLDI